MAYNRENLTKLKALEALAQRVKQDYATKASVAALEGQVDALETSTPTKVSELANDAKYQTEAQVGAAIQTAIAATGHAIFEKVDAVPGAVDAQENVLYLVMNPETQHYDIYAKVGESVELLDDTTVDLTGYVAKETGKGLSSNDYTDEDKAKLAGFTLAADEEVAEMLDAVFGAAV